MVSLVFKKTELTNQLTAGTTRRKLINTSLRQVSDLARLDVLCASVVLQYLLYFFGYKTEFFSFQNNPKNLDLSCKTDLDLWDCLGRVNPVLLQIVIELI